MTDFDRVFQEDADRKREKQKGHKALLFKDYLNLVKADPLIAQNSPSRILEVVLAAGVEDIPEADHWLGVRIVAINHRDRVWTNTARDFLFNVLRNEMLLTRQIRPGDHSNFCRGRITYR